MIFRRIEIELVVNLYYSKCSFVASRVVVKCRDFLYFGMGKRKNKYFKRSGAELYRKSHQKNCPCPHCRSSNTDGKSEALGNETSPVIDKTATVDRFEEN